MDDDRPFGSDTLKLPAIFIPKGNPNQVSAADISATLGHDAVRLRAILIPDGNPNNVSAADITDHLGHDVVRIRYAWRESGDGGLELAPLPDGPGGGGQAGGSMQGADSPVSVPSGLPTAPPMPPTPTLAQRYVDPAKTAVTTLRSLNILPRPSPPVVSHDTDGQGEPVTPPDAGPGESAGSSEVQASVPVRDPIQQEPLPPPPGHAPGLQPLPPMNDSDLGPGELLPIKQPAFIPGTHDRMDTNPDMDPKHPIDPSTEKGIPADDVTEAAFRSTSAPP